MKDPIVEEIRKIRNAHSKKFNYDLHAICEDYRKKNKKLKTLKDKSADYKSNS